MKKYAKALGSTTRECGCEAVTHESDLYVVEHCRALEATAATLDMLLRTGGTIFTAPGIQHPGPHTECFACGAPKNAHRPDGECPRAEAQP